MQTLSRFDALINEFDRALKTLAAPHALQARTMPKAAHDALALSEAERKHAAGLMRVNHAGEVAAQALYFGHAAAAHTAATQSMMLHAAREEGDHLAWCADRLQSLGDRPSLLGPIWYVGAYAMGYAAAKISDKTALGFVAETERQVEAHLHTHESALPAADTESLAVIKVMRLDEAAHGLAALNAGGSRLPWPIPTLMAKTADVMRFLAYRV
jgi:ubiquinone biosynthesis monooxygenase Coq7